MPCTSHAQNKNDLEKHKQTIDSLFSLLTTGIGIQASADRLNLMKSDIADALQQYDDLIREAIAHQDSIYYIDNKESDILQWDSLLMEINDKSYDQAKNRKVYLEQVYEKYIDTILLGYIQDQSSDPELKYSVIDSLYIEELSWIKAKNNTLSGIRITDTVQSENTENLAQKEKVSVYSEGSIKKEEKIEHPIIAERKSMDLRIQRAVAANAIPTEEAAPIVEKQGFIARPLNNTVILHRYGNVKHAIHRTTFQNNGVDLLSGTDNLVKCVFDGTVAKVIDHGNGTASVIVQHEGGYATVYADLKFGNVQAGDNVSSGQVIGLAETNDKGQFYMHFQIWNGTARLNPHQWLKNN